MSMSAVPVIQAAGRLRRALRRHGPAGLAKRVARDIRPSPRRVSVLVWYSLDLASPDRPRPPIDLRISIRPAAADDLWLLEQLPTDPSVRTMSRAWVEEQIAEGAQLWIAHDGDRAAFRCWVFDTWFPLGEARAGGIRPPAEAVILEDALSSPAFRGRGIAPSAYATIADAWRDAGARRMYTKVNTKNVPSRRAVEKAGFREVAQMQVVRHDYRMRVRVITTSDDAQHEWLRTLQRG